MNKPRYTAILLHKTRVERTYTGGKLLDQWQGVHPGEDGLEPEEWIASTTAVRFAPDPTTGISRIKNEEFHSGLLSDFISSAPEGILGEHHYNTYGENQAFLTKIIDSDKRLNIQTHPDRSDAKKYFDSNYGKTEAWYVMGSRIIEGEEPYILMGFKPGITKEKWIDLIEKQDISGLAANLHKVPIKEGDVFLIPSGMPHAIGSGCMIAEIQEPTDITFRVEKISHPGRTYSEDTYHQGIGYEKMYGCFDYTPYELDEIIKLTRIEHEKVKISEDSTKTPLITSEDIAYFSMERMDLGDGWTLDNSFGFSVATVLKGKGTLTQGGKSYAVEQSSEIFLPCSDEPYTFTPAEGESLQLLMCYPPDREI